MVAKDGGMPALSSSMLVSVKILDINDEVPRFVNLPSYLDVPEVCTRVITMYLLSTKCVKKIKKWAAWLSWKYAVGKRENATKNHIINHDERRNIKNSRWPMSKKQRSKCICKN